MTSADDNSRASFRRGVYLVLIAIGMGAVLGRILAVDAIDKTALQEDRLKRIPQEVKRERALLEAKGFRGQELDDRAKRFEEKLLARPSIRRPFLSGNDRSRWCTVRALVEPEMRVEGAPYAIDKVIQQEGWDTIDMVKHDGYLYSSKPPLLSTLMAGPYWMVHRLTGLSLDAHAFELGRAMLIAINGGCLLLYFLALAGLVERLGVTDWGRIFVLAAGVFGTFLTTFAVVLTNHLIGATCAAAVLYFFVRIWIDGQRRWPFFALAGFCSAMLAANELPAAALAAVLSLALLWRAPRLTLVAYVPPALVVTLAFFGTNWIAHRSLKPAYMHRRPIVLRPVEETIKPEVKTALTNALGKTGGESCTDAALDAVKTAVKSSTVDPVLRSGRTEVLTAIEPVVEEAVREKFKTFDKKAVQEAVRMALEEVDKETERPDNWYDYAYDRGRTVDSYWRRPSAIDRGEPSLARYTFHAVAGYHGVFSLTPMWLMSICGTLLWLRRGADQQRRELAVMIGGVTLICLAFYLWSPSVDRNYGGMSSAFRWVFWLAPAWLVLMLPTADASAQRRGARAVAAVLLLVSVLSASYPTWNPWTNPWPVDLANHAGWPN